MTEKTNHWTGAIWLPWVLLGLALALRLHRLTAPSFWVDEMFTLKAVEYVRAGHPGFLFADLHGPLYTAVATLFSYFLSGEGLRIISAVAGSLCVLPIHAWAKRVAGDRVAALSALLVALSPFAIWYGQELRNYSFVLLFSACLWMNLESWREARPGLKGWLAFVLFAWLGLLSNLTFLLFVIASGVAILFAAKGGRVRALGLLSLAAVGLFVLTLPWVISFVTQMEPQRLFTDAPAWDDAPLRGETNFAPLALPYTFYALLAGFSLGPSLAELHWGPAAAIRSHLPVLALAGLFLIGALGSGFVVSGKRRGVEWLLILVVVLGLASFLAIRNFKVYNVRYVSMVWPLLMLLVAWGAVKFPLAPLRRTLVLAIPIIFASSLAQHYWNEEYSKEDCRAAATRIESLAGADDLVLIAVLSEPFHHYYAGSSRTASLWPGESSAQISGKLRELGDPGAIWLVSGREWEWGSREDLLGAFPGYIVATREDLTGLSIYKLARHGGS